MNSSQQESLSNFVAITNCQDEGTAQFFLESSGWDLSQAVETYFGSQEAGGEVQAGQGEVEQQQQGFQIPRPNVRQDESSARARGNARGGGQVRGFSDLGNDQDDEEDEDDEQGNEYYTGGEKSGMVVKAPGKKADEEVESLFNKAREMGAREGTSADLEKPKQKNFTGTARTLDGRQIDSQPDNRGQRGRRQVTFYRNGIFTVDGGEARSVTDPDNQPFMQAIMRGECPAELESPDRQPVEVDLIKKDEDYKEPEKPKVVAFTGSGQRLRDEGSDSNQQQESVSGQWEGVNENEPTTSIQLRLSDGSRMVARFNHTHTIADIRRFIRASRPDMPENYQLMTTFPRKTLSNNDRSIAEEELMNAVITQQAS